MYRVLVGSTATIVGYPRVMRGHTVESLVPDSGATARRVAPVVPDAVDAYVAANVDTSNAADLAVAAVEGDTTLTLEGPIDIVAGYPYRIVDLTTRQVVLVFAAVTRTSTSTVWLQEPLPCDIAINSTMIGIATTVDLDAAQTAQVGSGYVLFRASCGTGIGNVEWDVPFRVVRRITSIALTVTNLTQLYPVSRKLSSSADTTLEEAIGAAWTASIQPWLSAIGILDEDVLTDDVLVPVHAAAVVLHLARQWPQAQQEYVDRLQMNYEQAKETTKARIDLAIRGQEETPSVPVPGAEPRISIRLSR